MLLVCITSCLGVLEYLSLWQAIVLFPGGARQQWVFWKGNAHRKSQNLALNKERSQRPLCLRIVVVIRFKWLVLYLDNRDRANSVAYRLNSSRARAAVSQQHGRGIHKGCNFYTDHASFRSSSPSLQQNTEWLADTKDCAFYRVTRHTRG